MTAPFFEARHRKPVKVALAPSIKVKKVVCGFRHSLAITEDGQLFGWGYNNQQQLSHAQEYADDSNPMHAMFQPQRLLGPLADLFVVDAAAGEEMSMIVAQGKKGGRIFEQTYACGNNLKGSLGINRTSHLQDLTLVPDLSDLFDESETALTITNLQCGRRHCVAAYDYGAFLFWGDNQVGQLGNRKRAFIESPYPSKKFEYRHNIENVVLGIDSSCVIVEDTGRVKKKNKKKTKRILPRSDVVHSDAELKLRAEQMLVKETQGKADSHDARGRRSLGERISGKFHETLYGSKTENTSPTPPQASGEKRELDKLIEAEKKQKEATNAQEKS